MKDLSNLDLSTLFDMLAQHTNEYMKMLKDGSFEEEYVRCKNLIKNLTAEIESRKENDIPAKKEIDTKPSDAN